MDTLIPTFSRREKEHSISIQQHRGLNTPRASGVLPAGYPRYLAEEGCALLLQAQYRRLKREQLLDRDRCNEIRV